jgi:hypothetical protein
MYFVEKGVASAFVCVFKEFFKLSSTQKIPENANEIMLEDEC